MKDAAKARTRNGGVGELGASQKAEDFHRHIFCLYIFLSDSIYVSICISGFVVRYRMDLKVKKWTDVEPIVFPK